MFFLDGLRHYDLAVLRFSNQAFANTWNDVIFRLWSSEVPWVVLTLVSLVITAYRRQWLNFKTIFWIGATVGLSDAFAAQIVKPWAQRIRPCRIEDLVRIVDGCAGSLSFPSNHASNGAAFAAFWFLWRGPRSGLLVSACVFIVGFSRLYLGMHYPSDVIGGFFLGGIIGSVSYLIYRRVFLRVKKGAEAPLA